MIVTLQDTVALKYCRRGTQAFCDRHGLDWHEFRKNGLPVSVLHDIDDDMVRAVIDQVAKRYSEERE